MDAPEQPPSPPPLPPPLSQAPAHISLPSQVVAAVHKAVSVGLSKVGSATATSAYRLTRANQGGDDGHGVDVAAAQEDRKPQTAPASDSLSFLRNRTAFLRGYVSDSYSDYVVDFRFPLKPDSGFARRHPEFKTAERSDTRTEYLRCVEDAFADVVSRLTRAGVNVETRRVGRGRLFLFVICPVKRLGMEALRSRVNDFLWGVRGAQLNFGGRSNDDFIGEVITKAPLTPSERLRLQYGIITGSLRHGGAGVIPRDTGFVNAVFPLHDRKLNKAWIRDWSLKWRLGQDDLNRLRDQFGEQVGYYFAFLQFYFMWLTVPAVVGLPFYLTGNYFNIAHGTFTVVWSILFVAYWRRHERKLAILWDVRETSRVEHPRPGFVPESEVDDPVTGEKVPDYPLWKRYLRQTATFLVVMGVGSMLLLLIGSIFAFEVFLTEFYRGPGLFLLIYSPTVVYSALVPTASSMYLKLARRLTTFENQETETKDDASLSQKIFLFTFMVSYLSIFLTAYVYIPLSGDFENWFRKDGQVHTRHAVVGRDRIVGQLIYFVLTGQVINFANEIVVPYFTRLGQTKIRGIAAERKTRKAHQLRASRHDSTCSSPGSADEAGDDEPAAFVCKVRSEADKPEYDLYEDFAEMVTQFGYVSMFSVGWPIIPLICFVNNWVELRSDAVKICMHTRRPIPKRTDTIGPWLDNLELLTLLASITNITLAVMYRDFDPPKILLPPMPHLLLATLAAENAFFAVKYLVKRSLEQIPSTADAIVRKRDYELKRQYIPEIQAAFSATATLGKQPAPIGDVRGDPAQNSALLKGMSEIRSALKGD